jgi:nicotinamidase-related amidase
MSHSGQILIVVDMQNGFINGKSRHIIGAVGRAVAAARQNGVPIFFTRFQNLEGSAWERLIGWSRLREPPETDLHPDVAPWARPEEIVDKAQYSSLVGPVAAAVESGHVVSVALCGIATDGCVLKTAVDLFEAGVRPLILTDAVASHAGEDVHNAGLLLAGRFIGRSQLVSIDTWAGA